MARKSSHEVAAHQREIKVAKWRYLLRNRDFRDDLILFRCTGYARGLSPTELYLNCPFPLAALDPNLDHPSRFNMPEYDFLYTDKDGFADPEIFWERMYFENRKPPQKLSLGKRIRMDKVDFYCTVYSLVEVWGAPESAAKRLGKPLPTVRSALAAAERIIGCKAVKECISNPSPRVRIRFFDPHSRYWEYIRQPKEGTRRTPRRKVQYDK